MEWIVDNSTIGINYIYVNSTYLVPLEWENTLQLIVSTNGLDDLVLEDLMKRHEVIVLEHVGTMLKLMKMWRFGVSRVNQASWLCAISG